MDEGELEILFKTWRKQKQRQMKFVYLKVMNGRTFKVFHWHVITWIYFVISDYSLERPPCITLIQNQVGRTFRRLWRMRLARSFGWEGRINLDMWNYLDKHYINHRVVQVYRQSKLWNFRKRSFARFLFLRTSMTWKVVQIHWTRLDLGFLFLVWTAGF